MGGTDRFPNPSPSSQLLMKSSDEDRDDWKSLVSYGVSRCLRSTLYYSNPFSYSYKPNKLIKASEGYITSAVCYLIPPVATRTVQFSCEFIGSKLYSVANVKYFNYSCGLGLGKFSHLMKVENLYVWRLMSVDKFEFAQRFNFLRPGYSHYLNVENLRLGNFAAVERYSCGLSLGSLTAQPMVPKLYMDPQPNPNKMKYSYFNLEEDYEDDNHRL